MNDIDSKRGMIIIRHGKGAKDRYTLLAERLVPMLREYYREYKPRIRKKVTAHTLRHSFPTHFLEHGIDLTYIQEFLGHPDIKTSLIFNHITAKGIGNIKSPLDNLEI